MAEPGDPHSPTDGAPGGPNDDDLFRDDRPSTVPQGQSQRPTWASPVRPAPEIQCALPEDDPHAHDDLIGFTSPASLAGTRRQPVVPDPEPMPELFEPEPVVAPFPQPDPLIHAPTLDTRPATHPADDRARMDEPFLRPSPVPFRAAETPFRIESVAPPVRSRSTFGRADRTEEETPEGATGLYTIYAMILFAVPTFGVAAMLGLLMVWSRARPDQALARSHFEFQTRTLWIAAIAAVVGVVLIAVNLGVFVLFLMALWVIVRGAWGIMTLAAGNPVRNPRTWLI